MGLLAITASQYPAMPASYIKASLYAWPVGKRQELLTLALKEFLAAKSRVH